MYIVEPAGRGAVINDRASDPGKNVPWPIRRWDWPPAEKRDFQLFPYLVLTLPVLHQPATLT